MTEDLGTLLSNGFNTWKRNLNICFPFIFNILVNGIVAIIALIAIIFAVLMPLLSEIGISDPSTLFNMDEKELEAFIISAISAISAHITEYLSIIVVIITVSVIIMALVQAFFTAGAVGMAKSATGTGRTTLSDMVKSGKQNFINLLLAEIVIGLILLAGIVFIVPGFSAIDFTHGFSEKDFTSFAFIFLGVIIWVIYALIISIALSVVQYALVIENLGPIDAISTGFKFFMNHKLDVFLVWLVIIAISFGLGIIGQIVGMIPYLNDIWLFVNMLISVIVIYPLMTLWWTRLYMSRTGKPIAEDLLSYRF
ncbi:MAG: hypothetical protein ACE5KT_01815 [Methanosarcinales archaeon]